MQVVVVLFAPLLCAARPGSSTSTSTPIVNDRPTLFGIADEHEDLSILREVYKKTEMKFKMEQSRDATILMPTNTAFIHRDIRQLSYPMIVQILNYHNLPEVHKFGELSEGEHSFESVEGAHVNVTVSRNDGVPQFIINNKSKVISDHIDTVNGVAYMISEILIPPCISKDVDKELGSDQIRETLNAFPHPMHNLDIPKHVQKANRENDRYDDTPMVGTLKERSQTPASHSQVQPKRFRSQQKQSNG
eukprot:Gregarina_sp_Poly_1__1676@NODE_142_length_12956_cov_50_914035_g127_i0_p4_GENE_NODE_142_length_12956_cov_50_914035_g127_i0NODE_142_length_12956_cov_50_914035_g127_i0_p4_ORF_typecomplete_len247_score23_37Fasciclin/PF02469_22/4_4e16_NODE_142_length_12956_cov_50_914035_g127_i053576097